MPTPIFTNSGVMAGVPSGGRGFTNAHSAVSAGIKKRGDLFIGSRSNLGQAQLADGYSFTGGQGKLLVDSIQYDGNKHFNVYQDAPKPAAPEPTPEPTPEPIPEPEKPKKPYQESAALTEAKERVQAWEGSNSGSTPSPYGREKTDFGSMVYGAPSSKSDGESSNNGVTTNVNEFSNNLSERKGNQKDAQSFSNAFIKDVKTAVPMQRQF